MACISPARIRVVAALALLAVFPAPGLLAAAAEPDDDDAMSMPAFNVSAEKLEDFGIQVGRFRDPNRSLPLWPVIVPVVSAVFPNTAAARAGIKPGDEILRADGKSAASNFFSRNRWRRLETAKAEVVANASKEVVWTLEVRALGAKTSRVVKLSVPTPAPRWGGPEWAAPEGRTPAKVAEPGPLADRAGLVLDQGIAAILSSPTSTTPTELGLNPDGKTLVIGAQWILTDATGRRHRMFVSQQRGHTDIVLEVSGVFGRFNYLTSPSGALERALRRGGPSNGSAPSIEEARPGFQREIEFWLNGAAKVSPRWPLEVAGGGGVISMTPPGALALRTQGRAPTPDTAPRAAQFLQLPRATASDRDVFDTALAKVGADEEHWAYTETSQGLDDKHISVVRFDPSKSGDERAILLKYDGKPPTPAQVKTWRDQGRDNPATLGDLPPLASVVDLSDARIHSKDFTSIVFELPIRGGNPEFPADKLQALFRVNLTTRAFEDIVVKMRESITVAGLVKITDAGLEARFQTFDPAHPPQPVWLKAGGSARLLFVRISRSFETKRTDFVRVQ